MFHLLSDYVVFPFYQVAGVIFVAYSAWRHYRWRHPRHSARPGGGLTDAARVRIIRGEVSMARLGSVFVVTSLVLLQINQGAMDVLYPHFRSRAFVNLIDVLALFYLCFVNPWSRNLIHVRWGRAANLRE